MLCHEEADKKAEQRVTEVHRRTKRHERCRSLHTTYAPCASARLYKLQKEDLLIRSSPGKISPKMDGLEVEVRV